MFQDEMFENILVVFRMIFGFGLQFFLRKNEYQKRVPSRIKERLKNFCKKVPSWNIIITKFQLETEYSGRVKTGKNAVIMRFSRVDKPFLFYYTHIKRTYKMLPDMVRCYMLNR